MMVAVNRLCLLCVLESCLHNALGLCLGSQWSTRRESLLRTTSGGLASSLLVVVLPQQVRAAEDTEMRTSSNLGSYEQITGEVRAANLGAGSVAGKTRPETGVILTDEPELIGDSVFASIILTGSVLARVAFDLPANSLKLTKGFYYDVESRSKKGDTAYLQVVRTKSDTTSLVDAVLAPAGRFGAFGAPSGIAVLKEDASIPNKRYIDLQFEATTPGGSLQPRRARIAVLTAPGSNDSILLVATASQTRWNDGGAALAASISNSFRIDSTSQTKLPAEKTSDYRRFT